MRYGCISIALIALMMAGIAVSGCTDSNAGGEATQAPAIEGETLTAMSQLYHADGLHEYIYSKNSTQNKKTQSSTYDIIYNDEIYHSVAAKHALIIRDTPSESISTNAELVIDLYTSKADNSVLGGRQRTVNNGAVFSDMNMSAVDAGYYTTYDLAYLGASADNVSIECQRTETITVNGRAYSCTRYDNTTDEETTMLWYTPEAPMPVKETVIDSMGNKAEMELLSWS